MKSEGANPDPKLTAADVRTVAGLSYRQVNDWDAKGALPNQREQEAGWRKFSVREIFVIMVTAEIRGRFGTSIESLRFVQSVMLKDGVDCFMRALELMSFGFAVYLFTDLKETFIVESDEEFGNLFKQGLVRDDAPAGYVFLCVNPIVNRLLACLEDPAEFKIHHKYYNAISLARKAMEVQNPEEIKILTAIRQRDYKRIVLTKKNDENMILHVEQELPASDAPTTDLNAVIAEHEFQTVTVSRVAGKNVRITRRLPLPLKDKKKKNL